MDTDSNVLVLCLQVLNLPHQVTGIVAISAIGINVSSSTIVTRPGHFFLCIIQPLVAILKPDPESKW